MKIIITGAAGFLGQRLAYTLLNADNAPLFDQLLLIDAIPPPRPNDDRRVRCQVADLAAPGAVEALLYTQSDILFHLAAIPSYQAEADFEFGIKVNFDVIRYLLEACRRQKSTMQLIFPSSLASFSHQSSIAITESTPVDPRCSYGAQKALCELLINEYSRKGFIDGRILRLPTISVQPNVPNQATASFASTLIEHPLQGKNTICPVDPNCLLWLSSPESVINNLLHATTLPQSALGDNRIINLPGISVTVQGVIDALSDIAGADTTTFITFQPDALLNRITTRAFSSVDTQRAVTLGFNAEQTIHKLIQHFISHDLSAMQG